jgi:hypothetical protein
VESANVRGAEAVELGVDPLGREGWSLLVGPSIGLFALFAYDIDKEAQPNINDLSKDSPKERRKEMT